MPELFDALGDLDDDTEAAAPEPDAHATPATPKADPRAALERVFAILGRPLPAPGTATACGPAVPSARCRAALEELAQCATIAELDAKQVNLKVLAKDLLDWHLPDGQTRATGNVVKALARALLATGEDGVSRFPQAVEMAGFAAAAAPLLQPDRLARLIDEASKVSTAFAPDRYTMRFAGALHTVLDRYAEQRRETLLISLWHTAHDGRWWDVTSGVSNIAGQRRRRANAEQAEADAQVVRDALAGHRAGTAEANAAVAELLLAERLPYNAGTRNLVAALPPTPLLRDGLLTAAEQMRAGRPVYPDKALLLSAIPWAYPAERPESPIAWMVRTLTAALLPDPDTGEVLLESLPDKPKKWAELYPDADVTGFPYPRAVYALDGKPLNGTGILVEVVKNAAELAENRDYMGNCTYGYRTSAENGSWILLKLWQGADCYNASFVAHRAGEAWQLGEINSRFNRGNVPPQLRAAAEYIAAHIPAREYAGERRQLAARAYRAAD